MTFDLWAVVSGDVVLNFLMEQRFKLGARSLNPSRAPVLDHASSDVGVLVNELALPSTLAVKH